MNSVRRLITHGCSFTYGEELENPTTQSWPGVLAKSITKELINLAQPAYANDAIVQELISFDFQETDFVIVAWTWQHRMIFFDEYGWYPTIPEVEEDFWHRGLVSQTLLKTTSAAWLYERWLTQVILLQHYLKNRNIPFLFFNAFPNYQGENKLLQSINETTFMELKTFNFNALADNFSRFENSHPNAEAHKAMALKLEKYMLDNGFSVL